MESKQGEILMIQNEIQWSSVLKGENLQKEKFEEQQKEVNSYKTK